VKATAGARPPEPTLSQLLGEGDRRLASLAAVRRVTPNPANSLSL